MIVDISSADNPLIKHAKQLTKRKYREKTKEYMIEGLRIVWDALENGKRIQYILFSEELYKTAGGEGLLHHLNHLGMKLYRLPDKVFNEMADTQNPQGVIAILPMEDHNVENIFKGEFGFFLVLDRIQDPGNMGTIIRTADAAGVDGILITQGSVDIYNHKVIRSTMGSIFHLPIIQVGDTIEIVSLLKQKDVRVIATSLNTEKYYYDIDYGKKTAILISNEANGIQPEVEVIADEKVKIPMIGKAESLNASIAASLMLYEVVRQKHYQKI